MSRIPDTLPWIRQWLRYISRCVLSWDTFFLFTLVPVETSFVFAPFVSLCVICQLRLCHVDNSVDTPLWGTCGVLMSVSAGSPFISPRIITPHWEFIFRFTHEMFMKCHILQSFATGKEGINAELFCKRITVVVIFPQITSKIFRKYSCIGRREKTDWARLHWASASMLRCRKP